MRPRRTHDSNGVLRLSGGTEDNDLWIEATRGGTDEFMEDDPAIDTPVLRSVWEPDAVERKAIANGANVRLTVLGSTHPPVSMAVVDTPLGRPSKSEAANG
jgi:hypothetical protein